MLMRLEKRVYHMAKGLAVVGLVLLLVQGVSITIDALARWVLSTPVHGLEDANGLLIAVTLSCFLPLLMARRGNITIGFIGRAMGQKAHLWLDAFGQTLTTAFFAVLVWHYGLYALDLGTQHTVIVELPKRPAALMATGLLGVTLLVQGMSNLCALMQAVYSKREGM
ncbi:hypothetical protein JCM17844_25330 [Iodidimonas gelatinilytica]|uniref:TRAP transporter small permease protein n=2 Tax=Iodidimonas gelatinilytica TaxID=1236966 RepID=A0A5A7N091_9PROT|nr:hypothetical protein JCM17844_25330 [Iodidimonas gelatinilytica]GER01692.1 hypothetical protein JCM17845_23150 [Iodidimonas gelatinilytica]